MSEKPTKVSFSFTKKKSETPQASRNKKEQHKEFISVIDKSFQKTSKEETKLITIPLIDNKKRQTFSKIEEEECEPTTSKSISTSDLDKRAIEELSGKSSGLRISQNPKVEIVTLNPKEISLDGGLEPSEDDFESIPVEDFGLAMLRGMGGSVPADTTKFENINVRPRGMGLGAGVLMKINEDASASSSSLSNQSELKMKKGSRVKILAGNYKESYGTIEAFEECGRVTVKLAIGGIKISINEYLASLVAESEFDQKSKILNNASFESFKSTSLTDLSKNTDHYKSSRENPKKISKDINKRSRSKSISPPNHHSSSKKRLKSRND